MSRRKDLLDSLLRSVGETLRSRRDRDEKLGAVCRLLKENVSYYNWVGLYIVDRKRPDELVLGPFEGEPTEHVRIPFGRGICGQAAKLRKTFVVQDTSKETNYLSCSVKVKSEIVVPIFRNREIVGELDIDSHSLSPFSEEDEDFLKKICEMVSELL